MPRLYTCEQCHSAFADKHNGSTNKFCSRQCFVTAKAELAKNRKMEYGSRHGGKYPSPGKIEIKCHGCGTVFFRWPSMAKSERQYCSAKCRDKNCPTEGRGPKDEHGKTIYKVPLLCPCGKIFFRTREQASRKIRKTEEGYCSWKCYRKHTKVDLVCEQCHKPFQTQRGRYKQSNGKVPFCGKECYGKWRKGRFVGPESPSWRGGRIRTSDYGDDWSEQREKCFERDGYCCQVCLRHESVLSRTLHAHHIRKFRESKDNSLGNLVSLCGSCHPKVEKGKIPCPSPKT